MDQFEYIIVGAGSAGAVLAARLSEDPNARVLLLEAGRAGHLYSRFPISFGLLIHDPAANWLYESEPEEVTARRVIPVPRGKLLGGSSAINGLVWVARRKRLEVTTLDLRNSGDTAGSRDEVVGYGAWAFTAGCS